MIRSAPCRYSHITWRWWAGPGCWCSVQLPSTALSGNARWTSWHWANLFGACICRNPWKAEGQSRLKPRNLVLWSGRFLEGTDHSVMLCGWTLRRVFLKWPFSWISEPHRQDTEVKLFLSIIFLNIFPNFFQGKWS